MANGLILNVDTTKSEFQNPMVELRQGDGNYQSLHVTVTNNGDPVDLTGWTITFMGTTAGAHKIVDANAVVDNALQGTFNYTPTKAWGQDIGEFNKAYFKFVKSDETASGANFRVNVLEAVDLTDEEASDYISVVDALIDTVKTDMDAKLADTQTTLTNTQNQANTVQTNVNDLNTNVNELKAQNNNLLTSNNTWSGSNTFSQLINGALGTRTAPFTDFADVAVHMRKYSGNWVVWGSSNHIANSPNLFDTYLVVSVIAAMSENTGYIIVSGSNYNKSTLAINVVNNGALRNWELFATDGSVVHNTGNETIAGNKTFTGANTFSGINNFNAAQNFNGGVIGVGYSSLLNTGNGLSVIASGAQQTTDAGQSWHKLANDDSVVHLDGTENITGSKTFSGNVVIAPQSASPVYFSGFSDYVGQSVTIYKSGNVVTITGAATNSSDIANGGNANIFTLPAGYRPLGQYTIIQQGSGINRFLITITADGVVNLSRYGTNVGATCAAGNWLNVAATFIVG